ncbi:DUF2752 domain-containing protein [Kitasatospora aburaviensis]
MSGAAPGGHNHGRERRPHRLRPAAGPAPARRATGRPRRGGRPHHLHRAGGPERPGHYPTCPFLAATGWWCPGCGGLRCVHALVHGDLSGALHDNAPAVLLFAVLAVFWVRRVWAAATGGPPPRLALGVRRWVLVGLLLLVFTVVRNLPIGAGLAPPLV